MNKEPKPQYDSNQVDSWIDDQDDLDKLPDNKHEVKIWRIYLPMTPFKEKYIMC